MSKIIYINLTEETVKYEEFNIKETMEYGRGLAAFLIIKNVSTNTDRYDGSNAIVLAPGLCSGTLVPSTGRITIASKKSKSDGIQFADIAGSFSQKLASLDIAAVVMTGKSNSENPVSVVFSECGTHIEKNMNLKEAVVSNTINEIRKKFGFEADIIGIGPTGEHLLPLSSLFSTYPEGKVPEYHCTRGGMGDIFGSKGIKALVVKSKGYFNAEVLDKEGISKNAKKEEVIGILDEIRKLSVIGRLIGSKTQGIYSFYSDKTNLKPLVTIKCTLCQGQFKKAYAAFRR